MTISNKDNSKMINSQTGEEFGVPVKGSLGLLALGSVGVRAWRKAKKKHKQAIVVKKK